MASIKISDDVMRALVTRAVELGTSVKYVADTMLSQSLGLQSDESDNEDQQTAEGNDQDTNEDGEDC